MFRRLAILLLLLPIVRPADAGTPVAPGAVAPRLNWAPLGPQPITNEYWSGNANASGRVSTIAVDQTDAAIVYAATAAGGLWKTTDGGTNWTPLTDQLFYPISGAVAIDPSNHLTIYYGAGDYDASVEGNGLFRSLDGGQTWIRIAVPSQVGYQIARVVIHPTNPLIIHVAGSAGVSRSIDGGQNWSVLQLENVSDLVINPTSPSTLYCGRRDVGVFKSVDGGVTWNQLFGGLPATGARRINLDLCRSSPQTVYAGIINSSGGLLGFYGSVDGGANWTRKNNTPNYPAAQGWFNHFVAADPANAAVVYAGGVFPTYAPAGIIRSSNSGGAWADITVSSTQGQIHPNQHCLAFGPDGTIWVGSDGGVWKSTDSGTTWINCNARLATAQIYAIALHPSDPSKILAGTQDNGSIERSTGSDAWPQLIAGDGGFAAYDFEQPTRRYTTYIGLRIFRFISSGYDAEITGPWTLTESAAAVAPLVMDPSNPRVLLGGTTRIWRTPDATLPVVVWTPLSVASISGAGVLTSIAVSNQNSNTIYAGGSLGSFYATTDSIIWLDRSAGLPPGETISDIVIDPANSNHLFVSTLFDVGGRVLESTNAGVTWNSRANSLTPGLSGVSLAVDWNPSPPALFLGTGVGVFASYDNGATWIQDSLNLPNVAASDLAIDAARRTLTVGTYGRGVWRTALPCTTGDLNFDGVVSPADIPAFVGVIVSGNPSSPLRCAADINLDGVVNGKDIQLLVNLAFP